MGIKLTGSVDVAAWVDEATLIVGTALVATGSVTVTIVGVATGSVTVTVVGVAVIWTAFASSAHEQRSDEEDGRKPHIMTAAKRSTTPTNDPIHPFISRS